MSVSRNGTHGCFLRQTTPFNTLQPTLDGQCRLLEGCPHEERRVHSREQERQERIEEHEGGASGCSLRSRTSANFMAPSTTSTGVIASARSRSNALVVTRAVETTPMSSIAAHGVPPALTRANTPGASPSRANPKMTRAGS